MAKTFIVGFDGSEPSKRALAFAAKDAKAEGAALHLVYVLEWSPYSFLTAEEINERHARRQEEVTRAESVIEPVCESLRAQGHQVTSDVRYGHSAEIICEIAASLGDAQIVLGRTGSSSLASRIVGSLGITLIQASPVPVTVVP